jgi:hypothetical protein
MRSRLWMPLFSSAEMAAALVLAVNALRATGSRLLLVRPAGR